MTALVSKKRKNNEKCRIRRDESIQEWNKRDRSKPLQHDVRFSSFFFQQNKNLKVFAQ